VTPHDLRHTAAVWMAADGVSMGKIAQYLGHSDSRITEKVYARFAPEHLRDAASALEL
jgi:integrase